MLPAPAPPLDPEAAADPEPVIPLVDPLPDPYPPPFGPVTTLQNVAVISPSQVTPVLESSARVGRDREIGDRAAVREQT
jgi:hypothetical protein